MTSSWSALAYLVWSARSDLAILDQLIPEPGAFYIMDRGFIDYGRLHRFHAAGAFFVIRAKSNLNARRRYSHPVDRSTGLRSDGDDRNARGLGMRDRNAA